MPITATGVATAVFARGETRNQDSATQAAPGSSEGQSTASTPAASNDTISTSPQAGTSHTATPRATPAETPTSSSAAPASNAASSSPAGAELSPMPERLRDLIVQQRRPNWAATPLRHFAEEVAGRVKAAQSRSDAPADPVKTRQQILADASKAMAAQANHTQESVLALLEVE